MPRGYFYPDSITPDQITIINGYLSKMEAILRFACNTEGTITRYKTYTRPFMAWCFTERGKDPSTATPDDIRDFLDEIQEERGLDNKTVNGAISHIRKLYETAFEASWNSKLVPFKHVDEFIAFVPTKKEVETLIASVQDPQARALLVLMYGTGLRISEACRVRFGEFITHGEFRLDVALSKRHKARHTVLPEKVFRIVNQYASYRFRAKQQVPVSRTSFVFPSPTDPAVPLAANWLQQRIPEYEAALGWPHRFTCHTFRRAFATHNYLDQNMTLEEISKALGHADVKTTKIYLDRSALWLGTSKHWNNSIDDMNI